MRSLLDPLDIVKRDTADDIDDEPAWKRGGDGHGARAEADLTVWIPNGQSWSGSRTETATDRHPAGPKVRSMCLNFTEQSN